MTDNDRIEYCIEAGRLGVVTQYLPGMGPTIRSPGEAPPHVFLAEEDVRSAVRSTRNVLNRLNVDVEVKILWRRIIENRTGWSDLPGDESDPGVYAQGFGTVAGDGKLIG